MLVDLYRIIMIILRFLFYGLWVKIFDVLFGKQNQKIRDAYNRQQRPKRRT